MSATYQAATAGSPGLAGHVNQFLVSHPTTYLYAGNTQQSQTTDGAAATNSNGLWVAQKFSLLAGVTTLGRAGLWLKFTGAPGVLHVSLRADATGHPAATELAGVDVPREFTSGTASEVSIPLPASGLTAGGTYWVVCTATGDASNFWSVERSNQTSGASTSPDGSTWTAQAYGFMFETFDQTATGQVTNSYSDAGSRWTVLRYDTGRHLTTVKEYTAGQTAAGYAVSNRALAYSAGLLSTVT